MPSIWPLLFVAVNHRRVTTVSDAQYGTFVVLRVCLRCVHDFIPHNKDSYTASTLHSS
jgi:hypothetical protein